MSAPARGTARATCRTATSAPATRASAAHATRTTPACSSSTTTIRASGPEAPTGARPAAGIYQQPAGERRRPRGVLHAAPRPEPRGASVGRDRRAAHARLAGAVPRARRRGPEVEARARVREQGRGGRRLAIRTPTARSTPPTSSSRRSRSRLEAERGISPETGRVLVSGHHRAPSARTGGASCVENDGRHRLPALLRALRLRDVRRAQGDASEPRRRSRRDELRDLAAVLQRGAGALRQSVADAVPLRDGAAPGADRRRRPLGASTSTSRFIRRCASRTCSSIWPARRSAAAASSATPRPRTRPPSCSAPSPRQHYRSAAVMNDAANICSHARCSACSARFATRWSRRASERDAGGALATSRTTGPATPSTPSTG